jgi:hypothetical protein
MLEQFSKDKDYVQNRGNNGIKCEKMERQRASEVLREKWLTWGKVSRPWRGDFRSAGGPGP